MTSQTLIEELSDDSSWVSLREARKALRGPMRRPDVIALARFLAGPEIAQRSDFDVRSVRVAVACDTSLDNLAEPLALRLLDRGMFGVQYHAGFAQLAQEVRDPRSGLLRHRPDAVVLAPLTGTWSRVEQTSSAAAALVVEEAWSHLTALRDRFAGLILLVNLTEPESRPHGILEPRNDLGHADFARSVNLQLSQRCRETGLAFLLDAQFLAARCGALWPAWHKQHMLAGRPLSDELAFQLAADIAAFCAALKGFARKCLVLDLDNTLWGGVVGEDGISGIRLGGAYPGNLYAQLQREIRNLRDRGVALAVISKNNEADAWEVFERRPEMVLRRSDISAHRINWQDKATNLCELAAELNLGLDAFVVLDDNAIERMRIEEALPEVEVCPASDPLDMLRWLSTCQRFDTMAITREDALRTKSYAAAESRARIASCSADLEGYLASLETQVEVGIVSDAHLARVAQLTQKTNQFNLTTRRYLESEIQGRMHDPAWRVFWCACRDRFADEGIIGAALARVEGVAWRLDTFLISCRVLGRGVEMAFLQAICSYAAAAGALAMRGEFQRTAKNHQTETFWESCGFTVLERTPERGLWQLKLPAETELKPRWIVLHAPQILNPIESNT